MVSEYGNLASVCLGIALSACCGFRVFIPLLAASIAAFFHLISLPYHMLWLSEWPALLCFGVAAIVEIGAYYIPFLDNILDTIATPLAVIAGTVLASALLPLSGEASLYHWVLGLIAGGLTAGTIQVGTGFLRLFITKATVGSGNVLMASGENAAALSGVVLSFIFPVVMALLLVLLVIWVIFRSVRRLVKHEESNF